MTVIGNPGAIALDPLQLSSPVTRAGYTYWLNKKGDRRLPARADFDPLLEEPRLAYHLVLIEVRREPLDFRYRLIGSAVREHMASDWTGRWISDIPMQCAPNPIWQHHEWVVRNGAPRFYRPANLGPTRGCRIIESAHFPLSADGETVDMMMVFVDFMAKNG